MCCGTDAINLPHEDAEDRAIGIIAHSSTYGPHDGTGAALGMSARCRLARKTHHAEDVDSVRQGCMARRNENVGLVDLDFDRACPTYCAEFRTVLCRDEQACCTSYWACVNRIVLHGTGSNTALEEADLTTEEIQCFLHKQR